MSAKRYCCCMCHQTPHGVLATDPVAYLSACSQCYGAHVIARIAAPPLELPGPDEPLDLGEGDETGCD